MSVANFLSYVDKGYYDGLIFHRVIPEFMIQGGGFTPKMQEKTEGLVAPIKNEANNGLRQRTRHDRHGAHSESQFGDQSVLHQPR